MKKRKNIERVAGLPCLLVSQTQEKARETSPVIYRRWKSVRQIVSPAWTVIVGITSRARPVINADDKTQDAGAELYSRRLSVTACKRAFHAR